MNIQSASCEVATDFVYKGVENCHLEGVKVLERERQYDLLEDHDLAAQLRSVFDRSTAVRLGRELEANYVVFGELRLNASNYHMAIRLVDIETTEILDFQTVNWPMTAVVPEDVVTKLACEMFRCQFSRIQEQPFLASRDTVLYVEAGVHDDFTIEFSELPEGEVRIDYSELEDLAGLSASIEGQRTLRVEYSAPMVTDTTNVYAKVTALYDCHRRSIRNLKLVVCPPEVPYARSWSTGFVFGGVYSALCVSECADPLGAFEAGLFWKKYFLHNIASRFEITYSLRRCGGNLYYENAGPQTGRSFKYDLNYVRLRVLVGPAESRGRTGRLNLAAGISYGIGLKSRQEIEDDNGGSTKIEFTPHNDFNLELGLGYERGHGYGSGGCFWGLEGRVFYGLSELSDEVDDSGLVLSGGKHVGVMVLGILGLW